MSKILPSYLQFIEGVLLILLSIYGFLAEVKVEPVTQDKGTSTVKQNGDEEHIKTETKTTTS